LPRITPEDLARSWVPDEAVGTLAEAVNGNAYYFNPAGVDAARTRRALDALRRRGVRTPAVVYLEARSPIARGRLDDAEAALHRVAADHAASTPFPLGPYEPVLPLETLARLELGKPHDRRGERVPALTEYRHVRAALDALRPEVPPDSTVPTLTDWATSARAAASRIAWRGRSPLTPWGAPADEGPAAGPVDCEIVVDYLHSAICNLQSQFKGP
jgi:hypothetical protein